jgi:hypothetical protein
MTEGAFFIYSQYSAVFILNSLENSDKSVILFGLIIIASVINFREESFNYKRRERTRAFKDFR